MTNLKSREIADAMASMILTCCNEGELYAMWDKTSNKQSDDFIDFVDGLIQEHEARLLKNKRGEVIEEVIQYWML